jgi:hypothetical protein
MKVKAKKNVEVPGPIKTEIDRVIAAPYDRLADVLDGFSWTYDKVISSALLAKLDALWHLAGLECWFCLPSSHAQKLPRCSYLKFTVKVICYVCVAGRVPPLGAAFQLFR